MGIDCWRPHVQLPGALSAPVYVRAAAKKPPLAQASRTSGRAVAPETRPTSKAPRRTAAEILTQAPAQARAAAPAKHSPAAEPARQALTGAVSAVANDAQLNLLLLECPGHCLIIDDAHDSREQQALLQNLMFAISAQPQASYRVTLFDWASIVPQGGQITDVLRGIVDRAVNHHAIRTILVMGDSSRTLFECDATAAGLITTPAWLSSAVQVIVTHSSKKLLLEPAMKADTWSQLQGVLRNAAS